MYKSDGQETPAKGMKGQDHLDHPGLLHRYYI
jgi:hypothetical protein